MYDLAKRIKKAESEVKDLKSIRYKLESKLLKDFDKEAIDGCKGARGVASIRKAEFPSIKDRRKFDKYVLKYKALDLFQNRLSAKAFFDRREEGDLVPGVAVFERIAISIKKRSK